MLVPRYWRELRRSPRQLIYRARRRSIPRFGHPKAELPYLNQRKNWYRRASMGQSTRACASGEVGQVRTRTPGHVPGIGRMQVGFRHISSSVRDKSVCYQLQVFEELCTFSLL